MKELFTVDVLFNVAIAVLISLIIIEGYFYIRDKKE